MSKKYKTFKFYARNGEKILTVRAKGYKDAWTPESRREPDTGYRRTAVGFRPPEAER